MTTDTLQPESNNTATADNTAASSKNELTIVFHDAIDNPIEGLEYMIVSDAKNLAMGKTNASGETATISEASGLILDIYVMRLADKDFKRVITTAVPAGHDAIIIRSPKVKLDIGLVEHQDIAGNYKPHNHIVKEGETVDSIAAAKGVDPAAIQQANKLPADNPKLTPGQPIKIPAKVAPTPAPAPTPPTTSKDVVKNAQDAGKQQSKDVNKTKQDTDSKGLPVTIPGSLCSSQGNCIKKGSPDSDLILEINVRLAGFGGALPENKFTDLTEKCVKQFQRDYMKVAETGRVCGNTLRALDDFMLRYPIDKFFTHYVSEGEANKVTCSCGHCNGWGTVGAHDELNGLHRSLFWILRSTMFYLEKTKPHLSISLVYSGYRCSLHSEHSKNHKGRALDVHFLKNGKRTRSADDMNEIRRDIFIKYMGAKSPEAAPNHIWLEPSGNTPGRNANTWVHFDVKQFAPKYYDKKLIAKDASTANHGSIIDFAKSQGFSATTICAGNGGILPPPQTPQPPTNQRTPIDQLKMSKKCEEFIKGFEHFEDHYYNDASTSHYATAGWGHKMGNGTCQQLNLVEGQKIPPGQADIWFSKDKDMAENYVKKAINVPLFQYEYDALCCLAYNLGSIEKKAPKLCLLVNSKKYSEAVKEFDDITNHGLSGLVIRRQREHQMFATGVYNWKH